MPVNGYWAELQNLAAQQFQYIPPGAPLAPIAAGGVADNNPDQVMKKPKKLFVDDLAMPARSASQLSDEYRDLASQIAECQASYHREQEELERAIADISRIVEVVQDIGSTVRNRLTILRAVATQLEKWRLSSLPPSSPDSETKPLEGRSPPPVAPLPAGAGVQQVVPGLWQQGQG